MFLGYPLSDWYAFFEAVEMFGLIFLIVVIVSLHNEENKFINKNRFIK
jgi:hypothetical protein